MPRKRTRPVIDKYMGGLNKDPTSASYVKRKANLVRLAKMSPTFPVKPEVVEEALGNPGTVAVSLRIQRYDHINAFFKSPEVQALGFPNPCDEVARPRKSELQQITEAMATREAVEIHLEIIRQDKDLSVNTLKNYRRALHRFADVVPTLPPDAGEIDDQIRVALGDPEEYANSTRRQRYIAMNQFFRSKTGREFELEDLLKDIPIPKKGEPRIVVLSPEELDALVNAAETPQERALVYLLLHTGIRIGEVEGLKVSDIVNGELTVTGKTGRRQVTLQPQMEKMLRDLANANGDIWWDDNGQLSLGQIEYRYRKIAIRAGISELGPHALRHTFATTWLRNGGGLVELQKILGHKDLATTQIYVHFVNDDVSVAQGKYAPTTSMGIFGASRIISGNQAGDGTVSGSDDAGNGVGFQLIMTPAAILRIQADRDREARVETMVKYLEQVPCEERSGGHPKIELEPRIARMILNDREDGHSKSALYRKYGEICRFSRTWLIGVLADGSLEEMAGNPPATP